MFKRIVILSTLMGVSFTASAVPLATGTISQINVSNGSIGVMITAAAGSACSTGWFYAYDSDTSTTVVSRLLSALIFAQSRGVSVSLYGTAPINCATSRFLAVTSQ